jgi:hypothetical protein
MERSDDSEQETAIIRLVERTSSAGPDGLDSLSITDLVSRATEMGVDIEKAMACLDGALSDEDSTAALRALIREWPAADDNGMGGRLSFAALAKRADFVGIGQAKVIACIGDGRAAMALRSLFSCASQ